MPIFIYAILTIVLSVSIFAQNPVVSVQNGIDEIYLAKDDGTGKAGEATSDFVTTDVPIYCIVMLSSNEVANVKMNFIAVDVPGVKAETKVVSASFTTNGTHTRVNFTGRPNGKWVAGKYRADIFIDNQLMQGYTFFIKSRSISVSSATPFQAKAKPTPKPKTRPSRKKN